MRDDFCSEEYECDLQIKSLTLEPVLRYYPALYASTDAMYHDMSYSKLKATYLY